MRILIAGSVIGNEGYEEEMLVKVLEAQLKKEHTVDTFLLPFSRNFLSLPDQILAYQLLDAKNCDMLITVGYPACMLEHSNKIVYLFDMAPHFWEYWDSEYGVLCNNQYLNIRDTICKIDDKILSAAKKVFCNSKLLTQDLNERLSIHPRTLYCPTLDFEVSDFVDGEEYIMTETNLLPYQRPELLIKVAEKLNKYKLKVFVSNANTVYTETLEKWLKNNNLSEKVVVINQTAGNKDYENAAAYITCDYNMRRISNSLSKAIKHGLSVFYADDCGAGLELLDNYNTKQKYNINNCKAVEDKTIEKLFENNSQKGMCEDISLFAQRLVEL